MLAALSLLASLSVALPLQDEVKSLPGWEGALPSRHFSGYLTTGNKHLHYYFVMSESDKNDPLVLWLNGGPGCSSLDGFFYEHGPFRINEGNHTKLERFDYTWAKLANMLYIEAPVGVGFSYSDQPDKDYTINDDISSQDNLHAVEAFFEKFPEYKNHDFFLTGESYAGIYVPTLAEAILWAKGNGTYKGAPLRGIAVGNGCTGTEIGVCGPQRDQYTVEYLSATGFIPTTLKAKVHANCNFSTPAGEKLSEKCLDLVSEVMETVGPLNIYDVYGECIVGDDFSHDKWTLKAPVTTFVGSSYQLAACINSVAASDYVNQKSVIEAMHVKPIQFRWAVCASAQGWKYNSNRPNLPRDTYPYLLKNIDVTIYNGDWDACVPYTDNQAWTSSMGLPVKKPWHPWTYKENSQIAGYATVYEGNLTFITIRGGRHEVPETAPQKAFEMLQRVIYGKEF